MEILLVHPEIPQNAGNIARTCVVTGSKLTLVRPLGFSTASRHLKRAGLDYWDELDLEIVDSLEEVLRPPFYFFSTKAKVRYTDVRYEEGAQLIFGSESGGLPLEIWEKYPEHFLTVPMLQGRSLNLSNAAAIVLYEAWRQQGFASFQKGKAMQ